VAKRAVPGGYVIGQWASPNGAMSTRVHRKKKERVGKQEGGGPFRVKEALLFGPPAAGLREKVRYKGGWDPSVKVPSEKKRGNPFRRPRSFTTTRRICESREPEHLLDLKTGGKRGRLKKIKDSKRKRLRFGGHHRNRERWNGRATIKKVDWEKGGGGN